MYLNKFNSATLVHKAIDDRTLDAILADHDIERAGSVVWNSKGIHQRTAKIPLSDGTHLFMKVAEGPVFKEELLVARTYLSAYSEEDVPLPRVLGYGAHATSGPGNIHYLFTSCLPGRNFAEVFDLGTMTVTDVERSYHNMGKVIARLHNLTVPHPGRLPEVMSGEGQDISWKDYILQRTLSAIEHMKDTPFAEYETGFKKMIDRDHQLIPETITNVFVHGDYHPWNVHIGEQSSIVGVFDPDLAFAGDGIFDLTPAVAPNHPGGPSVLLHHFYEGYFGAVPDPELIERAGLYRELKKIFMYVEPWKTLKSVMDNETLTGIERRGHGAFSTYA